MDSIANAQTKLSSANILVATDTGSWFWMLFVTLIFGGIWYGITRAANYDEIKKNWPKVRCNPTIMPFASAYGYDATENFQYCINNILTNQAGSIAGPFVGILGTMVKTMFTFLNNLNSLRLMLATFAGGVSRIMFEFGQRFKLVFFQVKQTSLRIQQLFYRVFATMYAMIYMGTSAITAATNFADTSVFGFLNTFCFAPETILEVKDKGMVQIQTVKLGDVLQDGSIVTSVYRFQADGQPTVLLRDVQVSTNHYVELPDGSLVDADEHPDAKPYLPWNGGAERPFVCLDTDTHRIPISGYRFSDWDETSESDESTMILSEQRLNGGEASKEARPWLYQPALDTTIQVRLTDGTKKCVSELALGDRLSTGTIVGIGQRSVKEVCFLPSGKYITPSQLIWRDDKWVRAGHVFAVEKRQMVLHTLVVLGVATIEAVDGMIYRDMCEVHSPDMELPTRTVRNPTNNPSVDFLI
jgi:hypothetical protein